ncbi:unnamed protein product, partial [Symbiodinium sp. KB8]
AFAATTAPSISCFGAVAAACEVGEAWQPALRLLSQLPPLLPDAALLNAILGACEELSEEEAEQEGEKARRALGLEDFHGHDGPSLQFGNIFMCLALRMTSPVSLLVVIVLLRLQWIRPVLSHGTSIEQATGVLNLYSAFPDGQIILFYSLLTYFCKDSYRSTGPLVAVLFPWAIFFALIPNKMAAQACASHRPVEVQRMKFVQLLRIIARQCGVPDETIMQVEGDGTEDSCDRAMRMLSHKDLAVRNYYRCNKLGIAEILHRAGFRGSPFWDRMSILSEDGKLVGDSSWMTNWPDTDRFVAQQRRIDNLAHIPLHVPPCSETIRANLDLLERYKTRLLSGGMKAGDFTDQVSVGFPIPEPFWVTAMHSVAIVLFTCALVASICLSWLMPQWHARGSRQHWCMYILFAWYGQVIACMGLCGRMLTQDIPELKRRFRELKVLNSMLAGQAAAAQRCLPLVRLQVPQDLLVWAEVRELFLARYSACQLEMETSVFVATLLTLGMAACSLYYALQEDWEPGLLSLLALQYMTSYVVASIPFFVMGVLVNTEGSKSLDLMSQHALQAQLALSQPGVASAEEREHIQETVTMASHLVQRLRDDSSAEVHVLGFKLTPSTASAIASAVASALAFTLRSLPMREIEDKLHESDAWDNITSILAINLTGKGSQWPLSLCLLRHSNDTTGRGALLEALATAAKWVTALALLQEGPVDVVGAFAAASAFESAQEPALLRAKQLRSLGGSKAPSLRKLLGELSGPHLGRRQRFSVLSSLLRLESAVARKLLEARRIGDSDAGATTRCRGHPHLLFLPVQPFRQFLTVCLQCELKGAEWVVHLDG